MCVKDRIKKETGNRMVSLLIDSATKHDRYFFAFADSRNSKSINFFLANIRRSFLGILAQYYVDGKLVVRTLGVRRLLSSHTGNYIAVVIKEVLESYDISVDQIYSITADNGANMIKAVKVIRLMQSHTHDAYFDDYAAHLDTGDQEFLDKIIDKEIKTRVDISGLFAIHCAAHTLELAIKDALKRFTGMLENELRDGSEKIYKYTDPAMNEANEVTPIEKPKPKCILTHARNLVDELRVERIVTLLKKNNLSKPPLDVSTRWSSKHKMVCLI